MSGRGRKRRADPPSAVMPNAGNPTKACSACDGFHLATHMCLDCNEYYCEEVSRLHTKMTMSRDHHIVDIRNCAGPMENITNVFCEDHKKVLEFYCLTCENTAKNEYQLLCAHCPLFHPHKGHELLTIDKARDILYTKVDGHLAMIKRKEDLLSNRSMAVAEREQQVSSAHAALCDRIHTEFGEMMEILERKKAELLDAAHAVEQQRLQLLGEQRAALEQQCNQTRGITQQMELTLQNLPSKESTFSSQQKAIHSLQQLLSESQQKSQEAEEYLQSEWEPCEVHAVKLAGIATMKSNLLECVEQLHISLDTIDPENCIVSGSGLVSYYYRESEDGTLEIANEGLICLTAKDRYNQLIEAEGGENIEVRVASKNPASEDDGTDGMKDKVSAGLSAATAAGPVSSTAGSEQSSLVSCGWEFELDGKYEIFYKPTTTGWLGKKTLELLVNGDVIERFDVEFSSYKEITGVCVQLTTYDIDTSTFVVLGDQTKCACLSNDYEKIKIFQLPSMELVRIIDSIDPNTRCIFPIRSFLIAAISPTVMSVWDASNGQLLHNCTPDNAFHRNPIYYLSNNMFLTQSRCARFFRMLNYNTGGFVASIGGTCVARSSQAYVLLVATTSPTKHRPQIDLYNWKNRAVTQTFYHTVQDVTALIQLKEPHRIAILGSSLAILDTSTSPSSCRQLKRSVKQEENNAPYNQFTEVAILLKDGRLVTVMKDNTICIWDTVAGVCVRELMYRTEHNIRKILELPDNRLAISTSTGRIYLWNISDNNKKEKSQLFLKSDSAILALIDGKLLTVTDSTENNESGYKESTLTLWTVSF